MLRDISAILLGLAFAIPLSDASWAEDFTFTVPVRVSRLPPEIDGLKIQCGVRETDPPRAYGRNVGGGESAEVRISGGAYSGDVVVAFNASPTADPSRARLYTCFIKFYGTVAGARREFIDSTTYGAGETPGSRPVRMQSTTGSPPIELPAAPGVAQAIRAFGTLP